MKILVAITSYGKANDKYLMRLIEEYRSMSHNVDIVVLSNIAKSVDGAEVRVGLPTRDPWSLPFAHKQVLAERVNDYDLFIYSEDDTLVTEANIRAVLDLSKHLPEREIPGFFRYEISSGNQVNYPEFHRLYHWDPGSVRRRGEHVLAYFTGEHSACYLLTQRQLRSAIASGGYLVPPHRGKYDLACTAATDPYTQCGFQKLICISHVDDFLVHHLSNKYLGTRYGVDDPEFRRQIRVLLKIEQNGHSPVQLFSTETALQDGEYSKDYYELAREEVISAIPDGISNVLSLGCGSGNTEASLIKRGVRVVAAPLDPVILGGANAKGVTVVEGDLETVRDRLRVERFDCLLLQNVLHLLPDPAEVLRSYAHLLSKNAAVIALVPNLWSFGSVWREIRSREILKRRNGFENSKVQFTHAGLVRQWFQSTGMNIEKLSAVGPSRKFGTGVPFFGRFAHSEFIVVARKLQ
jgi:SAM-dependent methyltransferase